MGAGEQRRSLSRADFVQYRRLFSFVRPYRWYLVVAVVGVLFATALGLVFPRIMGDLVDTVIDHYFPVVEDAVLEATGVDPIDLARRARQDLQIIRHAVWPVRSQTEGTTVSARMTIIT